MFCYFQNSLIQYSFCFITLLNVLYFLYTVLVISLALYKEYMICQISVSTFSAVFLVFTCIGAVGNLLSICLGANILSCLWSETLTRQAESKICPFPCVCYFYQKYPTFKARRKVLSFFKNSIYVFKSQRIFLTQVFGIVDSLSLSVSFKHTFLHKFIVINFCSKRSHCFKPLRIICFIFFLITCFIN